jgi:hypothetical protein
MDGCQDDQGYQICQCEFICRLKYCNAAKLQIMPRPGMNFLPFFHPNLLIFLNLYFSSNILDILDIRLHLQHYVLILPYNYEINRVFPIFQPNHD